MSECSNCRRKVCIGHAIGSEDARDILCSYCAILSKGLWPRVRPSPVNGPEHPCLPPDKFSDHSSGSVRRVAFIAKPSLWAEGDFEDLEGHTLREKLAAGALSRDFVTPSRQSAIIGTWAESVMLTEKHNSSESSVTCDIHA